MSPEKPEVSVIIPVYDDYDSLRHTLEHLRTQTYPASKTEVVVVDNGTPEARRPEPSGLDDSVRFVVEPKTGSYAARNTGVRESTGAMLAFTDADCRPSPRWLEAGISTLLDDDHIGLVGGRLEIVTEGARRTPAEMWEMRRGFPQEHYVRDLNFAATANMFTHRRVVEKVGPFQESLMSGGDREWGERVAAAGLDQRYCPDAVVEHPARRTLRGLMKKHLRTTRGDYQRRQLQGEITTWGRMSGIFEGVAELGIMPAVLAWSAVTAGGSASERMKYAFAHTGVETTRAYGKIEQLALQLLGLDYG